MQVPTITVTGDKVKRLRILLKIYSIIIFDEEITDRESQVLAEYLVYGCNKKAETAIKLNHGISDNNIKQINSRLQKKKLLIPKPYKQGKDLNSELEVVKTIFEEQNQQYLLIKVWS